MATADRRMVGATGGDARGADPEGPLPAMVIGVFFASGFAGLVYEVMFAKSLALVFGSTATAATTVLATYMGGMSLGSWLGGRIATHARAPLKLYAACEAGIALSCAVAPFAFGLLRSAYVALARGAEPGQPSLVALQVALGAALLLPPTLLMGATLPLLAKQLAAETSGLGKIVGALYGANTLGAACGALAAGYVLLQTLGVIRTTMLAVLLNLVVALAALRWAGRAAPLTSAPAASANDHDDAPREPSAPYVGWAVLGVGGAVTLALEGVYTHLLAVVAGNSAFAFSAMLFCFLVGLGLGLSVGRAWLRRATSAPLGLGLGWRRPSSPRACSEGCSPGPAFPGSLRRSAGASSWRGSGRARWSGSSFARSRWSPPPSSSARATRSRWSASGARPGRAIASARWDARRP